MESNKAAMYVWAVAAALFVTALTVILLSVNGNDDGGHGGSDTTDGNYMFIDTFIDTLNNVFDDSPESYDPYPDSLINTGKVFELWLANDLEAALKADILNPALKADENDTDPEKLIGWHITEYWDDEITGSHGKVYRQEFIVRNYDNLIREARKHSMINDESSNATVFDVIGSDEGKRGGYHSHYKYSRTGDGYRLSSVTIRTDELILDTEIYRILGNSYFKTREYYKAIVYYEKAIESDPDCAAEYYAMEENGMEKGEKAKWEKASGEAAKYFRQIIKPEPALCAASFYDMGESYIRNGEDRKGTAYQKKAETLGHIQ